MRAHRRRVAPLLLGVTGCAPHGVDGSEPPAATVDVLVIGAGAGGLSAATAAVADGASVLVLEKDASYGGSSWFAARYFGAGTSWQADKGHADTTDEALADWPKLSGGADPDASVVRFVGDSAGVLEWLAVDLGVGVSDVGTELGMNTTPRLHVLGVADDGPLPILAAALGDDRLWTNHTATGLQLDDAGGVIGASFEDTSTGDTGWVRASATIVATGGFARNLDLVLADRPELSGMPLVPEIGFDDVGTGIPMIRAAGASQNTGRSGLYYHSVRDHRPGYEGEALWIDGLERTMIVDTTGRRVANEETTSGFEIVDAAIASPGKQLYAIYDEAAWDAVHVTVPGYDDPHHDTVLTTADVEASGEAHAYDDAAAVAAGLGFDAATFQGALDRYDSDAAAHQDPEFGKSGGNLVQLHGPYVAVTLVAGSAKSFSGFGTDPSGRVLDAGGAPIPGLYGAGEVIGMLGTPAIGRGINGSITACYETGLVAGHTAVADHPPAK